MPAYTPMKSVLVLENLTQAEINGMTSVPAGGLVYNTTLGTVQQYLGNTSEWVSLSTNTVGGIYAFSAGLLSNDSLLTFEITEPLETKFLAGSHNSKVYANTTPTGQVVLDIKYEDAGSIGTVHTLGTITFSAGINQAAVSIPNDVTLPKGSHLYIKSALDSKGLGDVFFNIRASISLPTY